MVDEEVENILAEIRESVRARKLPVTAIDAPPAENGDGAIVSRSAEREPGKSTGSDCLARLDSYQAVTARAWDRLPPTVSNRSGSIARMELWVKRKIKSATHWFTWEQVNFNAAVHHALRDIQQTLASFQQELKELRAETESQRTMISRHQDELTAQREEATARLQAQRTEFEAQRSEFETRQAELKSQLAALETHEAAQDAARSKEMDARLSAFAQQMQERVSELQEEQRVCFKQLSLEATETAVLEDRARRKAESMIEEVRRRLEQIEKQ